MNFRSLIKPLLAVALLSTLSCAKKQDPEPAFEGIWDSVSSVSTAYTNGQPQSRSTTSFPGRNDPTGSYMTVTGTNIQSYYNSGVAIGQITYYTRSGNALATSIIPSGSTAPVPWQSVTITHLTATKLTIEVKVQPTPADYFIVESHYQRR